MVIHSSKCRCKACREGRSRRSYNSSTRRPARRYGRQESTTKLKIIIIVLLLLIFGLAKNAAAQDGPPGGAPGTLPQCVVGGLCVYLPLVGGAL